MGKTRDLFKKTGDSKQTFYVNMGTIKDRNSKTLTEAEQIKKRWQKHTEGKLKKVLMTQMTMMCGHSPRTRHPGVHSQVGLRKHYYKQS